ncbi:hypothetical protein N7475_000229 [Penicillium sp. IBT 31633x]|nr:hypothetical protein N7475_000229 [Penicillium sp. IBT 31633x]
MPIRYDDIVSGDIVKFEIRRYRTGNRHRQIQKQPISYRLSISYCRYRYIGNIVNSPTLQRPLVTRFAYLGQGNPEFTRAAQA